MLLLHDDDDFEDEGDDVVKEGAKETVLLKSKMDQRGKWGERGAAHEAWRQTDWFYKLLSCFASIWF